MGLQVRVLHGLGRGCWRDTHGITRAVAYPHPVRVFTHSMLGVHVVVEGEALAAFFICFFSCLGLVVSGDMKLAGNLESEVGTQSWWGPSCGCNIDLGPNLRKEAQLWTSNFAKLGSKSICQSSEVNIIILSRKFVDLTMNMISDEICCPHE